MSCGFPGNTDIFGIGIRIGYYTQALAVWFSNYFLYSEAKSLRAVNNLFLLALCIAATIYFANASSTRSVEAFLMLQIGLVIGLVGITERSRYSSKYVKNSKERMILRMVIIMAGGFFNVCFWWRELDVMLPTPCNGLDPQDYNRDGTYIFYIVKANIYGWASVLMKIKSLAAIVWTAPRIITFDAVVLLYNFRMRDMRTAFIKAVQASVSNSNREIREAEKQSAVENMELLGNVENAIHYMKNLFSIYPKDKKGMWKNRNVQLWGGFIRFHLPYYESPSTDKSASYIQCLLLFFKSEFTNNPPFDLRWMLALHMTASGEHPSSRWPRLLHRMYILGKASEPPDWRHVAIASDILLTQIPVVIKRRRWMLMAAWQFLFIVTLVLQVELTIAWNHVSGLQSLSSIGQLIPFILGVGGLVKVLWGKWRTVSKDAGEENYIQNGDYEDAMAKFLARRKAGGERPVVRAATA